MKGCYYSLLLAILITGFTGCASSCFVETTNGKAALSGSGHSVTPPSEPRLPMGTVFKGEKRFKNLMAKAEREGWRKLPIGERTARFGKAMLSVPYVNYTLEVHDRIESPVVNLDGMDCWTYYENALGMARLLAYKPGPYSKGDLLHMIELERYRSGRCTGSYLSRMHHLEEVFYDNQKRGLATNVTASLPGACRMQREMKYMTSAWRDYRYLRNNRDLIPKMAQIEKRITCLPFYHIPKSRVRSVEKYLKDGDICAITTTWKHSYTSHVGLIVKQGGRARFMHATSQRSKGRKMVLDAPISDYLRGSSKHAGIVICRPKDLPPSGFWENGNRR